nr:MAG TPA: hypothetical protein [Caudoviricetes sp.]
MLERVKQTVTAHKTTCAVILAVLLVGIAYAVGRDAGHEAAEVKPALMTQEEAQDARKLKDRLDISTANANALEKRITTIQSGQRAPSTTYYVTAPTVERAATVVERQIREDSPTLPMAAREKTDRTVVTPIVKDKDGKDLPADQQKVDVYKINLRKDHRIKAGATMIDGKALVTVGYEQGRFEALAHCDGGKYKGATVMYNVAEW